MPEQFANIDIKGIFLVFILAMARVTAVLSTFAITAGNSAITQPVSVTLSSALCLPVAYFLYSNGAVDLPSGVSLYMILAKEVFIGFLLGFSVSSVIIWAATIVGEIFDNETGMNNIQLFSPMSGQQGGPMPSFLQQLASTLFLSVGGMFVMAKGLYISYSIWPILDLHPNFDSSVLLRIVLELGNQLFSTAIHLAIPIIVLLLLVELAIGFSLKHLQSMNLTFLSQPIKSVVAIFALMIVIRLMYDSMYQFGTVDFLKHFAAVR